MRRFELSVNGLRVEALAEEDALDGILRPLVRRLFERAEGSQGRMVAFLAGPPGSGKSTLSLILQRLADERAPGALQALPMDGYHHTAAYIAAHTAVRDGETVPMRRVKGSPESFDLGKLEAAIRALKREEARWNAYDRTLHDVVEGATRVSGRIALVEGNWLLLREPGFSALQGLCDLSIALRADEALLKGRLIARKMAGGASRGEAEAHYAFCDRPNILRYQRHSAPGDINLRVLGDGALEKA